MAAEVCYRWMIGQDVPRLYLHPARCWILTNVDKTAEENLGWENRHLNKEGLAQPVLSCRLVCLSAASAETAETERSSAL